MQLFLPLRWVVYLVISDHVFDICGLFGCNDATVPAPEPSWAFGGSSAKFVALRNFYIKFYKT